MEKPIVHILSLLETNTALVLDVLNIVKDGIHPNDLMKAVRLLPKLKKELDVLKDLPEVVLELKDLNAEEIQTLLEKIIEMLTTLVGSR